MGRKGFSGKCDAKMALPMEASKQSADIRKGRMEPGSAEALHSAKQDFSIAVITIAVSLVAEPTSPALRYSLHAENFSARAHTLMYWKYLLLPVDAHAHTGSVLFPILPHLFTPSHSVFYFSLLHLEIFTGTRSVVFPSTMGNRSLPHCLT